MENQHKGKIRSQTDRNPVGRLTLASQPPPGAVSPGLSDNATRTDVVKGRRPMQRRGTGPAEPASGRGATAAPVRTGTKQGHPLAGLGLWLPCQKCPGTTVSPTSPLTPRGEGHLSLLRVGDEAPSSAAWTLEPMPPALCPSRPPRGHAEPARWAGSCARTRRGPLCRPALRRWVGENVPVTSVR